MADGARSKGRGEIINFDSDSRSRPREVGRGRRGPLPPEDDRDRGPTSEEDPPPRSRGPRIPSQSQDRRRSRGVVASTPSRTAMAASQDSPSPAGKQGKVMILNRAKSETGSESTDQTANADPASSTTVAKETVFKENPPAQSVKKPVMYSVWDDQGNVNLTGLQEMLGDQKHPAVIVGIGRQGAGLSTIMSYLLSFNSGKQGLRFGPGDQTSTRLRASLSPERAVFIDSQILSSTTSDEDTLQRITFVLAIAHVVVVVQDQASPHDDRLLSMLKDALKRLSATYAAEKESTANIRVPDGAPQPLGPSLPDFVFVWNKALIDDYDIVSPAVIARHEAWLTPLQSFLPDLSPEPVPQSQPFQYGRCFVAPMDTSLLSDLILGQGSGPSALNHFLATHGQTSVRLYSFRRVLQALQLHVLEKSRQLASFARPDLLPERDWPHAVNRRWNELQSARASQRTSTVANT